MLHGLNQCQNERQVSSSQVKMQDSTQRLILVLQSDSAYGDLIQGVLAESDMHPQILVIAHAQEALDFLRRQGSYAGSQRPDLILLDLDLAGEIDAPNLLSVIKTDPNLKRIPIIVLTLSGRSEDILNTYTVQGNCYVIRPNDGEQLAQIIRRIEAFWLKIVTLPCE